MSTLEPGARAPKFSLPSDSGETVALSDFAGKAVVLYFYPKDMTAGCTQQACDLRDSFARLTRRGAVVLGVSRDSVARHRTFREKYTLPFALLADVDGAACEAYGVWVEKSMYGRKYMGIERSTFVIDGGGVIRAVFRKIKVPGHVDAVLAALP